MTEDLKVIRKGRIPNLQASLAATALPLQEEMKDMRPIQSPPFPFFSLFVLVLVCLHMSQVSLRG